MYKALRPHSLTASLLFDTNHPEQVISAGGAGTEAVGFRYWNDMPFLNGFKGFLSVMPTCIFAMAGSENAGLVAAETKNPRRSSPKP